MYVVTIIWFAYILLVAPLSTAHAHRITPRRLTLHQPAVRCLFVHDFIFYVSLLFPALSFVDFCDEWANAWRSLRVPALLTLHTYSHMQRLIKLMLVLFFLNFSLFLLFLYISAHFLNSIWIYIHIFVVTLYMKSNKIKKQDSDTRTRASALTLF